MPSTEQRLRALVKEHLDLEDGPDGKPLNMDAGLSEAGVSSMAAVAFMRAVIQDFDIEISPEQFAAIPSLQALVDHIDSSAG